MRRRLLRTALPAEVLRPRFVLVLFPTKRINKTTVRIRWLSTEICMIPPHRLLMLKVMLILIRYLMKTKVRHINFSRIIKLVVYIFHISSDKGAILHHTKGKGASLHTQHRSRGRKKLYTYQNIRNAYTSIYNRLTIQLIRCKLTVIRYLTPSRRQKQSYTLHGLNVILKFNCNILKIPYSININKRRGYNSSLQSSVSLKHIVCRTGIRYYRALNV